MNKEHFRTARSVLNLVKGRNDWYSIKNSAEGAEVLIYDEIGYFGVTANDFAKDLQGLDTPSIKLRLNSPGGEVFDGIAIYNALKSHKAKVTTHVDGLAASIASVIAMAGDEIVMARNATMMIHDGHGLAVGNAKDMREMADLLDKTSNNIADIYAQRTGKSQDHFRELMLAETWFSADEAVAAGLADRVDGQDTTPQDSWDLSVFRNYGRPAPSRVVDDLTTVDDSKTPTFQWDPEAFRRALKEAQ